MEPAAEGGTDNWGEVVTRWPYRKVRLDHLLSKEKETCEFSFFSICSVLRGYSLLCQIKYARHYA